MTAAVPKQIGRYQIIDLLGQGGMGRVYKAHDPLADRAVALKILLPQADAKGDFAKRFLREARAAAGINHPNVIACYDVGDADGTLFMALELVTGGDVSQLMQQRGGCLEELEALLIMRCCAAGLVAIEQAGLVHRDIKPANIFLTDLGEAKLADLGLVRGDDSQEHLTMTGVPMGTPVYMSPEQARGESDLDVRSDIFALGSTLWTMLKARPPFAGDNPISTLQHIIYDPTPDPAADGHLHPATVALLQRCLAKEAGERPQHAGILLEQVQETIAAVRHKDQPDSERVITQRTGSERQHRTGRLIDEARRRKGVDPRDLQALAERVHVSTDRLRAWINLAPQAVFPSDLLRRVLATARISHGLQQAAILQASRPAQWVRRLVVACGDPPLPDQEGCDVYGNSLPCTATSVVIRVGPDAMQAHALFRPGELCKQADVKLAVLEAGLRCGIDRAAIARLWQGPPDHSGRLLIANGFPMIPGVEGGFNLDAAISDRSLTAGMVTNMSPVRKGQMLATWREEVAGRNGMDVYGRVLPAPELAPADISRYVGEGTRVRRDAEGIQILVADRDGFVQQQVDGCIRIITAVEVNGDCGPESQPIDTDEVVVVRGNVLPGAKIASSNDVVIMGDLADADVEAGGSLEVHGDIAAGSSPVLAGDTVGVRGNVQRKVVTGNLKVAGTVSNCALVATGDIDIDRVVGGSLTAGGNISVRYAGDEFGAVTEMWAGHMAGADERAEVVRLVERRLAADYRRRMDEFRQADADAHRARKRVELIAGSDYRSEQALADRRQRLGLVEDERGQREAEADEIRNRLAAQRRQLKALQSQHEHPEAVIEAAVIAHRGVVACIADADPLELRMDRAPFRMALGGAVPPRQR